MNELAYRIALTKIPQIGNVLTKRLVNHLGSATEIFATSKTDLLEIEGIAEKTAEIIKKANASELINGDLEYLAKNPQIRPVFFTDDDYPHRLRHHEQSPSLLYVEGNADLNTHRTVAIVGTRKPTEYGKLQVAKIVEGLKAYGVQIISGLAYGIDGCAHRSSVEQGVSNLAVLGSGIDKIYPQSHDSLAQKIKTNGAIISQFPFGTPPNRENFPVRNHVVAAMSDAIVVIESKRSGGSMITAQLAFDMNKDVFALPGRTTDDVSEGCNKLIKEHKANLMEYAKDVGYIMRWEPQEKLDAQMKLFDELKEDEKDIMNALNNTETLDIDTMHTLLQRPLSQLASELLALEFKGLIKSLPGKRYMKI